VSISSGSFADHFGCINIFSIGNSLSSFLNAPCPKASGQKLCRVGIVDSKNNFGGRIIRNAIQETIWDFHRIANTLMREVQGESSRSGFWNQIRKFRAGKSRPEDSAVFDLSEFMQIQAVETEDQGSDLLVENCK